MKRIIYFSKMFQAVPHLAQVHQVLPGTFVSSRQSTLEAVKKLYPQLATARYRRLLGSLSSGKKLLSKADVIVTGSPYKSFLQPYAARKCMVFHGTYMMLSKSALLSNAHYDLLCTIGPRMEQMIQRFAEEVTIKRTVNTGFLPFCEFPEITKEEKGRILLELGLNPEKQTVVYLPSRRGVGSWEEVSEAIIETSPEHYNLVLRPHPSQSLTSRRADRLSFKRVMRLTQKRPDTLLDLTSKPLPLLLCVADLVVSDANSPAEESLFYDVPQLFIETSKLSRTLMEKQAKQEGMHPQDAEQLLSLYDCGLRYTITKSSPSFDLVLDKAIIEQSGYCSQRQNYFSWVFGQRDRQANVRVAQAIQTYLLP